MEIQIFDLDYAKELKLQNALLIFLGCGIGGVLRYWISNLSYLFLGRNFPYGTLIVNVSGSFLMGLFFILIMERFNSATILRSLLLIGFLGGYTTFSSFSIETLNMFESGDYVGGLINIFLSTLLCLLGTWIGILLGRQL